MERPLVTATALRLALLGDGRWAAESLRRIRADGHDVGIVVLRRRPTDGALAVAAAELNVPVVQPAGARDPALRAALVASRPDVLVSIAYDGILGASILAIPRLAAVNFHAGRLPQYRGRNVITWALINGERELGLTAHLIDEGIDSGPILRQITLPLAWTDTYGDALERVIAAMPGVVSDTLADLARGTARAAPQDHARATYFGGRTDGDEWIDWGEPSERIHNLVRAISRPAPGARTWLGDEPVILWRAYADPAWPRYRAIPGQVVGRTPDGAIVKTGDSTLLVREVERPGYPPAPPDWPIGTRLGQNLAVVVERLMARHAPPAVV